MSDELVMVDELLNLGEESANDARAYLSTVTEVASGSSPDTAIPVLLLAVSQVLVAGTRDENLRNRKQQNRYRSVRRGARGNLGDRRQVGAGVIRRLFTEVKQLIHHDQFVRHRSVSCPRRPARE